MSNNNVISIIHYLPLEFYPPVINFLSYLVTLNTNSRIYTFSTHNNKNRKAYSHEDLDIVRFSLPEKDDITLIRILKYFWFNLGVLSNLIKLKPSAILYYESYSSYSVYLYRKYFNSKVRILIHNHEYFDDEWYDKGMKLVKFYHKKEVEYLYGKAEWISQTNSKRLELFSLDNPKISNSVLKILPNYPSEFWPKKKKQKLLSYPLKIVYVGSLSLDDCYIREFCEFVCLNPKNLVLDIYSYNLDKETFHYLNNINKSNINFYNQGIEYLDIPEKLINYDVGIILYKAKTLNFKYNAPNKLFEYLSCGLDVWYPKEMEGINEYSRSDVFPKIIGLDFNKLEKVDLDSLIVRHNLTEQPYNYFYESVYQVLALKLIE